MPAKTRLAAAAAAALALVGCSGGGGDAPPADTTAPAITSAAPADAATGVARSVAPRFTFSEAIDLATVTPATVTFQDGQGGAVAYGKAFDPATRVLTLTPSAALANWRDHTITFGTGVRDLAGNGLAAARTFAFRTADDVAPVVAAAPADAGAWDDAAVAFSWAAGTDDGSGVAGYRLQVASAPDPAALLATVDLGGAETTASFDASSYAHGSAFHARVAAVDAAGNTGAYSPWSDGVQRDAEGPVVAAAPAGPGAWSTSATVGFAWSAATDAGVGTVASYELEVTTAPDGGGTVVFAQDVGAALSHDVTGADGQTLHARVRARDALGNAGPWSASSQGVAVDLSAPAVVLVSPADASQGVARAAPVSVVLSEAIDPATLSAVTLEGPGGAPVACTPSWDASTRTLTLSHAAPLANYAVHAVRVATSLTDLAGNPLAAAVATTFRTADDVAPVLAGGVADAGAWDGHLDDPTAHFSWGIATDDGAGVAGYELQVALAPSDAALLASGAAASPAAFDASALADGDTLYARVRALDAASNASDWSAWSDGVALDRAAPSAPGVPGAYALSLPVRFSWSAATDTVSGPMHDLVQVVTATDGTGETYADANVGSARSVELAVVPDGTHLFARAAAVDFAGFTGPWSAWSSEVIVDLEPPGAPGTPADAGLFTESPARFTWGEAKDANGIASYVLEVTTEPEGAGTVVLARDVGDVLAYDVPAADGQALYARVAAVDAAGRQGPWSASSDGIVVDRSGPSAPGAPAHEGAFAGAAVVYAWSPADAAGSPVASYLFEVATSADFAPAAVVYGTSTSDTTATFTDTAGRDGQTVWARVRAQDELGHVGPVSSVSEGVTIDLAPPSVPGVPQDGGSAQPGAVVHLYWTPSADAGIGVRDYTVEIREDGALVATRTTATPVLDYAGSATVGALVTARVAATDGFGQASAFSDWSDGITINDPAAPGTPGKPVTTPAARYTNETTIRFTWTPPADGAAFDEYVVQVGTTPGGADVVAGLSVPSSQTSYTLGGATHATTYHATVAARSSVTSMQGAFSAPSDPITVDLTPPGAPGKPSGTYRAGTVTFGWPAAADPESGIRYYAIAIYVNGAQQLSTVIDPPQTSYAFMVPPWTANVAAQVWALNGVGVSGDLSEMSDPIPVDLQPPFVVEFEPWSATDVGTNADVVYRFSESMDRASVEAAFSLVYAGGPPANGYAFAWNAASTEVRIVPDTRDPVGATNVDLLPESTLVEATLADTATDLAGNPLASGHQRAFATADETAPRLLSVSVGGVPSPVPPASVQGGFALDLGFDEDMDPTRAGVSLRYGNERLEARYASYGIQGVLLGPGTATYVLWDCPDVRVGDVVTVSQIQPNALEAIRAPVTAVDSSGPCSFTVASAAAGVSYGGGGFAAIPSGNGARPRWSGPATLSVVFEPWVSLAPGSDTALEVWDVNDASGNWPRGGRTSLQVRKAPGTDATPPALLTTLPRQGGTAPGARLAILRFTEPLDRSTLADITASSSSGAVAYDLEYQNEEFGPMVFVMPRRAAPAGATITIHVPGTVKDLAGNAMGTAAELTYAVSPSTDAGKPALLESLPPDGRPVWEVWDAQVAFADALSGALDAIDATSVGAEDVRVEDEAGRLSRGWRAEAEPGSAFLRLYQPRGGFSGAWVGTTVTSVAASGGLAVYTTSQPHGMAAPGARVQAWMNDPLDQQFNLQDAVVREIVSPTELAVDWAGPDAVSVGGGWLSYPGAKTYTVQLLGVPGATGIADVYGNAMDPQAFQANVQPWGNRVPTARDLRDLSVAASTSPLGRSLELELGIRDADAQLVHVSVAVRVSGTDVPLATYDLDVQADPWGGGWYRMPQSSGGPPTGDSDPALAGLPSGLYPVTVTLDDGAATTTYVREVYLWAPADVPVLSGVDDGGTFRAMSALHPPVVENGPSPTFAWALGGGAAPDFLGLYVATLDGVGDQGGGRVEAVVAPPDVTGLAAPSPLATDVYLWTVVQQRFADGTNDPRSAAWALDLANPYGSLFVVGPDNDALGGAEYGAARIGFETAGGTLSAISDATGTWTFEPNGAADAVFVLPSMTDQAGSPVTASPQLFAYGAADAAFTVTEAVPGAPVPLPLPMRGAMGRAGAMFAVAQGNPAAPSIAAGAHRYQTSGFGTSLDGEFVFVQLEAGATGGLVTGAGGSLGTAAFAGPGSTTGLVSLTQSDGGTQTFPVPYTLSDEGLLALGVGGGGEQARGWIGGAPGAEVAALAIDVPPTGTDERTFWLLLARAYAWTGAETEASVVGAYRFADLSVAHGAQQGASGASGTLAFDGLGGFTYAVNTPRGVEVGTGTYAVDAAAGRVIAQVAKGDGTTTTLAFVVGPDFDTLLGMSTSDPASTEVLVVTR